MSSGLTAPADWQSPSSADLAIPADIVWHDVDGDLVLFNAQDGTYHALNQTASAVWRTLASGRTIAAATADLAAQFPFDAAAIADDVRSFVAEAMRAGLLAPASSRAL